MKKTILELQDERALLTEKAEKFINNARVEMRKLTVGEDKDFKETTVLISNLNAEIALGEVRMKNEQKEFNQIITNTNQNMSKFSLLRAIEARSKGANLPEEAQKLVELGKAEMRKAGQNFEGDIVLPLEYRSDILSGTATQGQETVAEQKMNILKPLRASLVLVQAGANFLTGLSGDVSIPAYGGTSAAWKGEVASADDGGGAFSEVNLTPKRLTAYINVSKQFLAQDSADAEAMLLMDIVNAVSSKLESTILGKADVSATQPGGLFFTAPSIKGAASFINMVAMETAVDTSNALAGNLKYITNPAGKGLLKTTTKAAGQPIFILENGEVNGYPVLVTNNVASGLQVGVDENGVIFGNFGDLVIAQWGGFDIIVDPYTMAKNGQVQIVINTFFDAKVRRAASFKTASIK